MVKVRLMEKVVKSQVGKVMVVNESSHTRNPGIMLRISQSTFARPYTICSTVLGSKAVLLLRLVIVDLTLLVADCDMSAREDGAPSEEAMMTEYQYST